MAKKPTKHVRFSAFIKALDSADSTELPKTKKGSQHAHYTSHRDDGQSSSRRVPETRRYTHPQPYMPKPRTQVHPALTYGAASFDLRCAAPGYAAGYEPAVFPPAAYLRLTTPSLSSAWDVTVYPQSSRGGYVTVLDVLNALHLSLRGHVGREEYEHYSGFSEKTRRQILAAFERRCQTRSSMHSYEKEKRSGIRRVDFLQDRTGLIGLGPTERADKFVYYVS